MSLSPISWIGGKYSSRHAITSLIPPHVCWVEVFSGALHVTLNKPPSMVEVVNDLNKELMNFWLVSRDHNEELIKRLDLPYSRELYQKWKNEPLPDDSIERAARWFYILCSSFASKYASGWAYGKTRNHAQEFRYSTGLITALKDRLKNVLVECVDFREIIKKYDSPDTAFFCDPPYLGQLSKEHYYGKKHNIVPEFTEQDHRDLAEMLNNIQGKAIVTHYPVDLIKELYPEPKWVWLPYKKLLTSKKIKEGSNRESRNEVILINYHLLENLL